MYPSLKALVHLQHLDWNDQSAAKRLSIRVNSPRAQAENGNTTHVSTLLHRLLIFYHIDPCVGVCVRVCVDSSFYKGNNFLLQQ